MNGPLLKRDFNTLSDQLILQLLKKLSIAFNTCIHLHVDLRRAMCSVSFCAVPVVFLLSICYVSVLYLLVSVMYLTCVDASTGASTMYPSVCICYVSVIHGKSVDASTGVSKICRWTSTPPVKSYGLDTAPSR